MKPHTISPLISELAIQQKVKQLGQQINIDYQQSDTLVIIALLKGAMVFAADLCRQLTGHIILDVMSVSSYGNGLESSQQIALVQDISYDIEGCDVLVIDDVIDTGHTLSHVYELLSARHAKSIKLCTLLSKPSCLRVDMTLDYVGFEVANEFVVGYGIDYAAHYRHLPYIAKVNLD